MRCSSKYILSSSSSIENKVLFVASAKKSITPVAIDETDLRAGCSSPLRTDLRLSRRSDRKSLRSFSSWMESWVFRALSEMNFDTRMERGDIFCDLCDIGTSVSVGVGAIVSLSAVGVVSVSFVVVDIDTVLAAVFSSVLSRKCDAAASEASLLFRKDFLGLAIPTLLPNTFIVLLVVFN